MQEKSMYKACPVVLRNLDSQPEILVFKHPLAGIQLAKGTIEPGESSLVAAQRELLEEAGVTLKVTHQLLEWQRHPDEPIWGICMMETGDHLPDQWEHYCEDDGGHVFQYFWHPLLLPPNSEWHPVFTEALTVIRETLADMQ